MEDPLPLPQKYRQRHIKLAPRLIADWQRVGVALDLLIRAGEIPPGKFSSCTAIITLLVRRTTTFDKTPEVYQKSIVRDVMDAIAPADSRARRRHNAIIDNLAATRLKRRDLLPSPAAQARDTAAREELRELAYRLPDGLPDDLPASPVSLRQRVEEMEVTPEMAEVVYASLRAEAKNVDTDGAPDRGEDQVEPGTGVEDLEDTGDEDLVEPGAGVEDLVDTREVEQTTEEKLEDILAAGRRPDPDRDSDKYLLSLRRRYLAASAATPAPVAPADPPAPRGGLLSRLLRKERKERT